MEFIIKKLGGENAAELHKSAKNIYEDYVAGNLQAVVVSAIRSPEFNTTDKLIELGEELKKEKIDTNLVIKLIKVLEQFHLDILEEKLLCSKEKLIEVVKKEFTMFHTYITFFLENKDKRVVPCSANDYSIEKQKGELFSILGFGEVVSCRIFSSVIDSISTEGVCSKSVDLSNIVTIGELEGKNEKEVFDILSQKVSLLVQEKVEGGNIPVLSGYMGSFLGGIESAIGRGYSDATAAVCTVGLARRGHGVILEVQKSVKGLLSADPRILKNAIDAKVIKKIDYLTAREITGDCGAQAKLLHHQTLRSEVQEAGVRIHLYDPFSQESNGSWIEPSLIKNEERNSGVEFIGGRKNIIFFSISSGKMFENGILSRLFDIVKGYFPVDIVSASETEVSFTLDGCGVEDTVLEKMTQEIREEFHMGNNDSMEFIEYVRRKSLIFCVGTNMVDSIGLMAQAVTVLGENNINIEIASQGRLQRAMIFGIDSKDMERAVNVLHDEFIING